MNEAQHAQPIANNIQDHLSVAAQRNWSLFLFFRVLSNEEVGRQLELERALKKPYQPYAREVVKAELAAIDPAAVAFDGPPVRLAAYFDAPKVIEKVQLDRSYFLDFLKRLLRLEAPVSDDIASRIGALPMPPADAGSPEAVGDHWFAQGLRGICAHEALRYSQPDQVIGRRPILRARNGGKTVEIDGASPAANGSGPAAGERYSSASVNIAFTHTGLASLKTVRAGQDHPVLDEEMLDSFPDAFRMGMAARARSLGDTGVSAPENWEGELGKSSIHGMLTAYFEVRTQQFGPWERVRREVEEFNTGDTDLRRDIRRLFLTLGFEVLHAEFGQTPYDLPEGEAGAIKPHDVRKEHFGFRDGISQPFVDLGLKTPLPGGGTPLRDGSWAPVAAGEIYLGEPDEDGLTADQPVNATLRDGGTYLVFRKLEQDVAGFRSFLEYQRKDKGGQERLAAQLIGRWVDGAPLVRHPDFDAAYIGRRAETALNDFRYRSEDPRGVKCPIGSHVRRVNPRDTGGRNEAKYHRILRRSLSYGGPLLPPGSKGDGRARGLLFVAANARIEMQFEVIQRDWINGGEFLEQVGAGRCPLTGDNRGLPQDRFLEGGAIAPISGIPSFVTMKGGDYFFAPGIEALKAIAAGGFAPDNGMSHRLELGAYSTALAETPAMLTQAKIQDYARPLLTTMPLIRVALPREQNDHQSDAETTSFVFIGQHAHVSQVLRGCPVNGGSPPFSVAHYLQASREITRGDAQLLAMDEGPPLGDKRALRLKIMNAVSGALKWGTPGHDATIRRLIRGEVDRLIHRLAGTGRIDILQDLAFHISYRLVEELVGISGPSHLSELAVSLPFAKRHITQLPPDWLKGRSPDVANPGFTTTQIWSRLAFAEVIGNILDKRELTQVAIQATSELLMHIDDKIAEERVRRRRPPHPETVLVWLVQNRGAFPGVGEAEYFSEVRTILADLIVTMSTNIALPFSKALQSALDFGFNLGWLVPALAEEDAKAPGRQLQERFAYELLRLFPSAPAIYRRCEADTQIAPGAVIKAGEWVGCLLPVAGQDPRAFEEPKRFSLGKGLKLPPHLAAYGKYERKLDNYLLFGPKGGVHRCWGEALGSLVLTELFQAAARFPGLTRVAGPAGQVVEMPTRMDYSLKLKFYPFDPNRQRQA
jgi:Dyp-type peroxidase family